MSHLKSQRLDNQPWRSQGLARIDPNFPWSAQLSLLDLKDPSTVKNTVFKRNRGSFSRGSDSQKPVWEFPPSSARMIRWCPRGVYDQLLMMIRNTLDFWMTA
ncbi:hypothetical protein RISK_004297 [Rhodopirellula islandica]|uniref:Uncharacterized protein n=1 Tax=Rhodopirellula islandica TaxID=595434 RepID=A0A0J1BB88_RHOIS|nr:hypothetical protein RISK_004297 [Rhodopirellula islandica]